jgi:hypothetical protein
MVGSVICLSPIFSAIKRISLPDNQFRPLVVGISTISNPVSSLLRILRMHVRARTCCSIITSTGEFCDTRASSAGLEKSSMMSPNSEKGLSHSTSFDFHFPWSKVCPTHSAANPLLIATLLPTFEFVRRNVVRDLLVRCNRSSCCKYCDTRSPPPNSRGHRPRMLHLPSRDIEMACLRYLHPTPFFL